MSNSDQGDSETVQDAGTAGERSKDEKGFVYVWKAVVPSVAVIMQASFDSFFSGVFPRANPDFEPNGSETGSGPQCSGDLELRLRTTAFGATALVGLYSMKWNFGSSKHVIEKNKRKWFHWIMNFLFIFSWLFSTSDFPLTCWINRDGALTEQQLIRVSFVKFFLGTTVVNVLVYVSYRKPIFIAGRRVESPIDVTTAVSSR